jgi:hypothetical protein
MGVKELEALFIHQHRMIFMRGTNRMFLLLV